MKLFRQLLCLPLLFGAWTFCLASLACLGLCEVVCPDGPPEWLLGTKEDAT
jgi:hypothetical protein